MAANPDQVGQAILDTMPLIMRSVRADITRRVGQAITLPQFRVLSHLSKGDWCLSDLAAHQKVSLATMSKMVSGLVDRGYIERSYESHDRRFILLRLTPKGRRFFEEAHAYTRARLARRAATLSSVERDRVVSGLALLRALFEDDDVNRLAISVARARYANRRAPRKQSRPV